MAVNGELSNIYRRESAISYHPSMSVRRASVASTHTHPHVPELEGNLSGNYNYGYEEMTENPGSGQAYYYQQ